MCTGVPLSKMNGSYMCFKVITQRKGFTTSRWYDNCCFVSKKQGVAHAEASFLGGREKQNGLVDVQWEKGVKKQPSQKAGPNLAPSEPGHGTGAGVQVHVLATSMQGFRVLLIKPELCPTFSRACSLKFVTFRTPSFCNIFDIACTRIQRCRAQFYPILDCKPVLELSVNALEVVRISFAH